MASGFRFLSSRAPEASSREPGARSLIKLPSRPVRPFIRLERFLPHGLRLLLACLEYALLAASDALVRVQAFENELRRRNLLLGTLFLRDTQRSQLVDESLDSLEILKRLHGRHRVGKLNLA